MKINHWSVLALAGGVAIVALVVAPVREGSAPIRVPTLGSGALVSTSRRSLESVRAVMRARVDKDPGDGEAAVLLADALMRAARVESDASLAIEAERVVRRALAHDANDYAAQRMLGVVYLAQHRFAEALTAARTAQRLDPKDAWNHAVAGDALLEMGRYEEAFDAFDEVNRRRPDPASYARAAYARELQGDIKGALELMSIAADGTGAHDPEAEAWYRSQMGHLHLLAGQVADAERAFARAEFVFAGHPYARAGRARVLIAQRRYREAHTVLAAGADTPESWAMRGDIAGHLGDFVRAQSAYEEAERLERDGWKQEEPQPAALARFLAERRLKVPEAVALAAQAAAERQDIHTLDALAWSYFQAGQLESAADAIAKALRTGTRDPRIRCHAAAIADARHGLAVDVARVCDPLIQAVSPAWGT